LSEPDTNQNIVFEDPDKSNGIPMIKVNSSFYSYYYLVQIKGLIGPRPVFPQKNWFAAPLLCREDIWRHP